jgi:hypothetical protein
VQKITVTSRYSSIYRKKQYDIVVILNNFHILVSIRQIAHSSRKELLKNFRKYSGIQNISTTPNSDLHVNFEVQADKPNRELIRIPATAH